MKIHEFGNVSERILSALKYSELWTEKTKDNGRTISRLICPECGDREAWAYSANGDRAPLAICCNRLDNCGARTPVFSLFPELRTNVERDFKPTKEDPHLPARAYLSTRGINKALAGLEFEYRRDVRGLGTGAVMFPIVTPDGKPAMNGRLFSPPRGEGKTHNQGSTSGAYWRHPGIEYDRGRETFVVEGIVDALSLIEAGFQAVAVLAAGQPPDKIDLSAFPVLTLAFDSDKAGARAFRIWRKAYPSAGMVAPPFGSDWNDLLSKHGADLGKVITDNRAKYEHVARLITAETGAAYAEEWIEFHETPPGLYELGGEYWYCGKVGKKGGLDDENPPRRVGNFTARTEQVIVDESTDDRPEYRFRVKLIPTDGKPKVATFAAADLTGETAIRGALLARGRVLWEGGRGESLALARRITTAAVPEIRELANVGYDTATGAWINGQYMVDAAGRYHEPGPDRIFQLSRNTYLRAPAGQYITPSKAPDSVAVDAYRAAVGAWGDNARAAFGWMAAAWFFKDIIDGIGFFPFMSLYGDPATGKTSLLQTMNACQGQTGEGAEGLPLSRTNTAKGTLRTLGKRSGLFQGLIEDDDQGKSKFDYRGFMLPAYNGNCLQTRAAKTNDLTTTSIPMKSAVLFAQNVEPFSDRPQRERVISLRFKKSDLTETTRAGFVRLRAIPKDDVSRFFPVIMKHHPEIRKRWRAEFDRAAGDLSNEVVDARIRENHAIVLAFHRILIDVLGIPNEGDENLIVFMADLCHEKIRICEAAEDNEAGTALDVIMEHAEKHPGNPVSRIINDSVTGNPVRLVFSLAGVLGVLRDWGLHVNHQTLTAQLKKHPAFIRHDLPYRMDAGGSAKKKVWAFDLGILSRGAGDEFDPKQAGR